MPPDQIEALLQSAAAAGHALTYSEVLNVLGYAFSRPKMRALCRVLADVDAHARAKGEPELAVLVVRQSDGLPGQGWWTAYAHENGYGGPWEGPKARAEIERLQALAFAHWEARKAGTSSLYEGP